MVEKRNRRRKKETLTGVRMSRNEPDPHARNRSIRVVEGKEKKHTPQRVQSTQTVIRCEKMSERS
jgi:hypothetical protein